MFRGAWDREIKVTREGDHVAVSCESTRTTGFLPFSARIETVPTIDLDSDDGRPFLDFDGTALKTARLVPVVESRADARGATGTRRGRASDEEVDQVGPIVAELVRRHFDGRAPSQNKLLELVKDTREDHGLRRDRVVRCIPGTLERGWLHKGKPGRNGGCELLAGRGPADLATAATPSTNGATLFGQCDVPDDPTREDH